MIPASFAEVASKASPAVVNISTVKVVSEKHPRLRGRGGSKEDRDSLDEFFERFFGEQAPRGQHQERSQGSGFIIDPNGLIITNNHVVAEATVILVRMSDGKEYNAEILGRDPKTDLALIKVENQTDLPFLKLGDSTKVNIGDWVVAIGNPFGLEHTVTAGILSARGRVIGSGPYDDFLQTDASINPGNSGGPLLNLKGEVVGINTAIFTRMGAIGTGIGFAIPTKLAKKIVAQLKDKGRVVRGWLGVMIQKITPELARSFKLESQTGALVADVTPGGPAEKAGLKHGDVITAFNGHKIDDFSELPGIVADTPVGSQAKVLAIRQGKEKTFDVTIGELTEEQIASIPAQTQDLGLTVKDLTPELATRMGLPSDEGVVITGVEDDSPAAEVGLKPGDLIVEINREPVKNQSDYRRLMLDVRAEDSILFLIKRGSSTLFFAVEKR